MKHADYVLGGGTDIRIAVGALAAILLATAGMLNPLIAGTSMGLSSVLVVSNRLRLRRYDADRPTSPHS